MDVLLIANRGEIAIRIAATARAMGLRATGVYEPDDAGGAHLAALDEAVEIGSYLDPDAIVAAARRSGADAVHPGYGFLSESARLARAVEAAGLIWVGPPADAIERMGAKDVAKQTAAASGVPVVPGLDTIDPSADEVRGFAAAHGYPVVIKAVMGGGGKGMRVVRGDADIDAALAAARREAEGAFGDGRLLVERYLDRPRHIEVQVLADAHGAVIHLGERECSLQRRHQKVVEEAPSPAVGADRRARMGAAAIALARACDYRGAGTVEFIAPTAGDEFFFLEMNTRLQVEHPVTELVYGIDLVEQQLRIAAGEPLGRDASEPVPDGHAIEARIYAEDPAAGFLPVTGTVRVYAEPGGARIDSGITAGSEIGTAYDPLLAKLIAHGSDRAEALRKLTAALADLTICGVTTNAGFTRALLTLPAVRAGELDTGLLERELDTVAAAPPDDLVAAAALIAAGGATPAGPWRTRYGGHGEVEVRAGGVTVAGERIPAAVLALGERFATVALDGHARRYAHARAGRTSWIARDGHQLELVAERAGGGDSAAPTGSLEAPMPGTVLTVNVADGDRVEAGDVLLVLESMKMELAISAPQAGTVEGLALTAGERVALHQPLLAVTP